MQHTWWSLCILSVCISGTDSSSKAFQPEFAEPLSNLTVSVGRVATFRCLVNNLGGYRVGWVKADTKAIQAIHLHVITNNQRVSVSHNGQSVWNLHIKNVQEEDRGHYMCQINTDPMQSQIGYLDVVVPPDFVIEETSGDIMIPEGGTARLSCRATGVPSPIIVWKRQEGDIVLRNVTGTKTKVDLYKEETLILNKISRSDMGAYLCIATNGVPPSISKRIMIKVLFHPVIHVPNQLVGAPLGTDVTLECFVEASPTPINYWVRDSNEMVISSNKYEVRNIALSDYESHMVLTVHSLTSADVGGYRCVAKNSLGEVDSVIRLYEIPGATDRNTEPATKKEEYKYSTPIEATDNEIGSADSPDDEDEQEIITKEAHNTNKHKDQDNSTKNRLQNFSTTFSTNISNKVNKITYEILHKINSTNNSYRLKGNVMISCLSLVTIFPQYIININIVKSKTC